MSSYIKLFQACCNYGFVGSYSPLAWKVDWRTTDVGPGYEILKQKHRVPYESGPLPSPGTMRCRWEGISTAEENFGFVIDRWSNNAEQTLFHGGARFDWPEKVAWAEWDLGLEDWGFGPADVTFSLDLQAYGSLDGLFLPPSVLEFSPWRVDDEET